MGAKWTGGCMCGAVRYECSAEQPAFTTNCYCHDCQRASGTALTSNLVVPAEAVRITRGQLKYHEHTADSGNKVRRGFCADCDARSSRRQWPFRW